MVKSDPDNEGQGNILKRRVTNKVMGRGNIYYLLLI